MGIGAVPSRAHIPLVLHQPTNFRSGFHFSAISGIKNVAAAFLFPPSAEKKTIRALIDGKLSSCAASLLRIRMHAGKEIVDAEVGHQYSKEREEHKKVVSCWRP